MVDELIQKITSKVGITPEQAKMGLGIILKFAKGQLGPKYDQIAQHIPGADALIASAPAAGGALGALGGMMGGLGGMLGGNAGKLAGLAGLLGQAEKAGINKDQLMGIGQQAADYLKGKGGAGAADLLKGLIK